MNSGVYQASYEWSKLTRSVLFNAICNLPTAYIPRNAWPGRAGGNSNYTLHYLVGLNSFVVF